MEQMLSSLNNGTDEIHSLSDVYLRYVKPFYMFLSKTLIPPEINESFQNEFNYQIPPKQAYIFMQISIIIIAKRLTDLERACCKSIIEYRKHLENIYKDLDLAEMSKSLNLINKDLKLNSSRKLDVPALPSEVLQIYTTYFKNIIKNSAGFMSGLKYLNDINKNMRKLLNSFNYTSLRLEQKIEIFEVPEELQEFIPFIGFQSDDQNIIKMILDENRNPCRKASGNFDKPSFKKIRYEDNFNQQEEELINNNIHGPSESNNQNLNNPFSAYNIHTASNIETLSSNLLKSSKIRPAKNKRKSKKPFKNDIISPINRQCFSEIDKIIENMTKIGQETIDYDDNYIDGDEIENSIQPMLEDILTNLIKRLTI